jgi:hypothetical protein
VFRNFVSLKVGQSELSNPSAPRHAGDRGKNRGKGSHWVSQTSSTGGLVLVLVLVHVELVHVELVHVGTYRTATSD